MTESEIEKIRKVSIDRVSVCCDEYHAHSAERGCLYGDERDINILRLIDTFNSLKEKIYKINEEFK